MSGKSINLSDFRHVKVNLAIPEELEGLRIREISELRYNAEKAYSILSMVLSHTDFWNGLARGAAGPFAMAGTARDFYSAVMGYYEAQRQMESDKRVCGISGNPHCSVTERLDENKKIALGCLEKVLGMNIGFVAGSTALFSLFGFPIQNEYLQLALLSTNSVDIPYQIYDSVRRLKQRKQ